MRRWTIAFIVCAAAAVGFADEVKLPVTADVGICAHKDEQKINTGGRSQVRVKGIEQYYLFNFDAAKLPGPVKKATLHMKLASGKLRQVAFCTVPIAWTEGTASKEPQDGSPCYTHVRYPKDAWTDTGGTFLDATFNNPYMIWRPADVAYDGAWMKIEIAPELVEACRVGLSQGLAMSDEKGQTRENHDVFTREQANAAPYLTVETAATATAPATLPAEQSAKLLTVEPCPDAAGFDRSAIRVAFHPVPPRGPFSSATQAATEEAFEYPLGVRIRLLGNRTSDKPASTEVIAEQVVMRSIDSNPPVIFRNVPTGSRSLRIVGETFIEGHRYEVTVPVPPLSPVLSVPELPKVDLGKKVDGPAGLRLYPASASLKPVAKDNPPSGMLPIVTPTNAWVGFQVLVVPDDKKGVYSLDTLLVKPGGDRDFTIGVTFPHRIHLYHEWFVTHDKSAVAEALVPIVREINIPWGKNNVANQDCQPVFVDVWIPKKTPPGDYTLKLSINASAKGPTVDVPITVTSVELPDDFPIVGDMNTYNSPAAAMGVKPADAEKFIEAERTYYRLAHAHRMTLNVLPYSQSGNIDWRSAPEVDPKTGKIADWSKWDERYGPLLDGSAFSDKAKYVGPGANTPIHHMYLPFHENWPAPLADHFKPWPPPKDYPKFLQWSAGLPPIEECLDKKYSDVRLETFWGFRRHFEAKKWTNTRYQYYLNNKEQFRDKGRGISLWTLDEPMFSDDFMALAHLDVPIPLRTYFSKGDGFGKSCEEPGQAHIDFRVDISRPTHQRNWLDGRVQLNVVPDLLYSQRWWIDYRKRTFGEEYWDYHMPPSFSGDNLGWAAWPVKSFCWGATGTLPWQTIAKDSDYDTADATALMYPPQRFGLDEPIASIRMKAWRQGLQDATLLHMLRMKNHWTDLQVRAFVGQACGLDGWKAGFNPATDAPIVTFDKLKPDDLERLHAAVLEMLK